MCYIVFAICSVVCVLINSSGVVNQLDISCQQHTDNNVIILIISGLKIHCSCVYVFLLLSCGCEAFDSGENRLTDPFSVGSGMQLSEEDSDDNDNLGLALSHSVWPKGQLPQHLSSPIQEQDWKRKQAHVF